MTFPHIDPVALHLGPLSVRWYGLMYLAGFLCGWIFIRGHVRREHLPLSSEDISELLFLCVLGVVAGGRLGYVLFYHPSFYVTHPLRIFSIWEGGMSFHGGLIGVVGSVVFFCRRRLLPMGKMADMLVMAACFGLCFGRMGNFINGELWGRVTDVPWGMVFPFAGPDPRHPSQLYQAVLEGPVLFSVLWVLYRRRLADWSVFFSFVTGYAFFRFGVEFVRQPDQHLGLLTFGWSMGQWLSLPMAVVGLVALIILNRRRTLP
ncbi:MAG: prolipoprotein diacylglyceryl transferase [Desulfuromonadaceae bacterium]|nr:prolipoprotein diacylglyceryl transferase [Desulfuromonadaceae bacterium]